MKKAFVILVSLFIGVSSGFIAPSAVLKVANNGSSSVSNSSQGKSSTSLLEKSIKINENELYHNTENKTNNVNQRSFIFINKNLRKTIPDHFLWKSSSVSAINRSILSERLPKGYIKSQQPVVRLTSSQQLFNPNLSQNKASQFNSKLNNFIYPLIPKMHKLKSPGKDVTHVKENNKIEEHIPEMNVTVSKPIEQTEDRYIETNMKKFKPGDIVVKRNETNYQGDTRIAGVQPGLFYSNMRYFSHSQKKPKLYNRCGYVKPNWLQRTTFSKNHEMATFRPIMNTDGSNIKPSLDENIDYDKLEKYLKETLTETVINDESKIPNNDHYTGKIKRKYDDVNDDERNSHSEQAE